MKKCLYQLFEKFPEIPKAIVVKTDVIMNGVKYNETIKDIAKKHIPYFVTLKDQTSILVAYKRNSSYEIKKVDGKYTLFYKGDALYEVKFLETPRYIKTASSDRNLFRFTQRSDACLYIAPLNSCAYFHKNENCRFCDYNGFWDKVIKGKSKNTADLSAIIESLKEATKEVNIEHIKLTGGSLYNVDKEADIYVNFAEHILNEFPDMTIHVYPQALKKADSQRLFNAGVKEVCYDMEVWDSKLWPIIVPGKNNNIGRKNWLDRLISAVEVFGAGRVCTNFVAGYEIAHPSGFNTIEEGINSNLQGFEWCIKNGIEPSFFIWTPEINSYKTENENSAKITSDYYLSLGLALHKLMIKYGMYHIAGYNEQTSNPGKRKLVCHKCCYHSISPDFPR